MSESNEDFIARMKEYTATIAPIKDWDRLFSLTRRGAEMQWRPIEEAPKDGTIILGAFWTIRWADTHRKGDVVTCWWQPEFGAFISSCREMVAASGYTFECGETSKLHSPVIEPVTHYMPLPAPPASLGEPSDDRT